MAWFGLNDSSSCADLVQKARRRNLMLDASDGPISCCVQDLRESVAQLQTDPNCAADGKAPMYGMAASLPDRSIIAEFLTAFQDVQLTP